ncbi:hypothetical protein LCGC14_2025900 [marine sediment metagenome]|uniref:Uncharacterized protein n=1 Tax=marine sediment metagenome TaxID=412755 RepID=A0A0F9HT80_9ZZZZ
MRLPNPLAAYCRWAFRRRYRMAGIDVELAERLNEIGRKGNRAGIDAAMLTAELILRGYRGEALVMEMRRRIEAKWGLDNG